MVERKTAWVFDPLVRQHALDIIRLVDTGVLCRSKFARLFNSVSIKSGEVAPVSCKSWRCKKHRQGWGYKWHNILTEALASREITLLVNLTTAEFVDHEIIHKALRRFMQAWRFEFGPTEYLRVTEYNKNHTQPHFHLLVSTPSLKLPPMPARFREPENRKLSWPGSIFEWIKQTWGDCLAYFAPDKNRTTVVWCQPPANQVASAKYAINYITGKQSKDKNEEPDETWRGRKMCYSKQFFDRPAREIWAAFLAATFGPPDPDDRFCWVPNDAERLYGEGPELFARHPTMKRRYFEALYWQEHGEWPPQAGVVYQDLYYENLDSGQGGFYVPDAGTVLKLLPKKKE